MKILHTADWHIGKILHKHALVEEMQLFFDWLLDTIVSESVDILLVSGDVFDTATPSSKDRKVYYQFLKQLTATQIKVIITGGNHDSIGVLNAPSEILNLLDIYVIGGATTPIEDEIIKVNNKNGELELIVAAVPFLRDRDLRNVAPSPNSDRNQDIKEGMRHHYKVLSDHCEAFASTVPVIAMGHLYAKGASISDSERDIGNQSSISSDIFTPVFDYVALGHIHRPQIVAKNDYIRYSGSPIALSFSEKEDQKSICLIETDQQSISSVRLIPVPKQRKLHRITGSFMEVSDKLRAYSNAFTLPSLIELVIKEEQASASLIANVTCLVDEFAESTELKILKTRYEFQQNNRDAQSFFEETQDIRDLSPLEIFKTKLSNEEAQGEEQRKRLIDAFMEVVTEIEQNEPS